MDRDKINLDEPCTATRDHEYYRNQEQIKDKLDELRVQEIYFSLLEHIVGARVDVFRTKESKMERILHMYFITYVNPIDGKNDTLSI